MLFECFSCTVLSTSTYSSVSTKHRRWPTGPLNTEKPLSSIPNMSAWCSRNLRHDRAIVREDSLSITLRHSSHCESPPRINSQHGSFLHGYLDNTSAVLLTASMRAFGSLSAARSCTTSSKTSITIIIELSCAASCPRRTERLRICARRPVSGRAPSAGRRRTIATGHRVRH